MTFLNDEFYVSIEEEIKNYQKNRIEEIIGCYDFEEEKQEMQEELGGVAR